MRRETKHVIKSSPTQGAKDASGEFTFRGLTPAWHVGRHSDQLAFAPGDPVYIGLRNGRAVAGIFCGFDFEKQIQTREISHKALTNRRTAARIRSPLAPAASQTAFRVTIRHTARVSAVEMAILLIFLSGERRTPCDLSKWAMLSGLGTRIAERIGFLAVLVKSRNAFFTSDKQNLNQRPIALPIASAPKYSSQSNQGLIRSHPYNGLL